MPEKQLFFGNDQRSGDHALAGPSPLAVNVITDGAGTVRRRPGISAWAGFPAVIPEAQPIAGIYAFGTDCYFVNDLRKIYRVTPSTAVAHNLSIGGGSSYLAGTSRPVFAETAFRLAIAGGGAASKVEASAVVASQIGGTPPVSSHIVAQSSRLVVNDLTSSTTMDRIRYSGVGSAGNEAWSALGFVTAEARPDGIAALAENSNELFAFGSRTLQVFQPDESAIFRPGRALNRGCAAPYSVIKSDDSFAWFSEQKTFLLSDGRSAQGLSDSIDGTLDRITMWEDAYGFRWNAEQYDCLCWLFPTDGRTFVVQQGGGWAQWHGWTDGQGHTPLPITSHYYWPEQNVHLVGLSTGQIAKLDSEAPTDLGAAIKAEVLTGYQNRDTDATKHCQAARFTFRRGHATGTDEPQVLLSWRDNLGAFCSPIRLSLGVAGDDVFTIEKRSLGAYRARQWRLEFTDAVDFVLARAEEIYTVGGGD